MVFSPENLHCFHGYVLVDRRLWQIWMDFSSFCYMMTKNTCLYGMTATPNQAWTYEMNWKTSQAKQYGHSVFFSYISNRSGRTFLNIACTSWLSEFQLELPKAKVCEKTSDYMSNYRAFFLCFAVCLWYSWWFRNPKQPPGIYKTLEIMG